MTDLRQKPSPSRTASIKWDGRKPRQPWLRPTSPTSPTFFHKIATNRNSHPEWALRPTAYLSILFLCRDSRASRTKPYGPWVSAVLLVSACRTNLGRMAISPQPRYSSWSGYFTKVKG